MKTTRLRDIGIIKPIGRTFWMNWARIQAFKKLTDWYIKILPKRNLAEKMAGNLSFFKNLVALLPKLVADVYSAYSWEDSI